MTTPKDFLEKWEQRLTDPHVMRVTIKADELRHLVRIARAGLERHKVWSRETYVAMDEALRDANLLREEEES